MPNRSDIKSDTSEGSVQDGIPLRLILHVYDVDDNGSCIPLSDAKVDIWQQKWLEEREGDGPRLIAIHPSFDKLLTALRTAVANEYKLDQEQTSFNDLLDAFRLSLQFYKRSKS